jgi:hypothetical protein
MLGCTVRISGDDNDNRIVDLASVAGSQTLTGEAATVVGNTIVFNHITGSPDPGDYFQSYSYGGVTIHMLNAEILEIDPAEGCDYQYELTFAEDVSAFTTGEDLYYVEEGVIVTGTLQRPYMGSTGTGVSATVYADAIPLPSNVRHLLGPVDIPGERRLIVASSAETFHGWNGSPPSSFAIDNKCTGTPERAFVDTIYDSTSASLAQFLRVEPMPTQAFPVAFRAKLKPPTFTAADVADASYDDPETVLPGAFIESAVLPIALKRWTAYPHVSLDSIQRDEIDRQYKQAIDALEEAQPRVSRTAGVWAQG